MVRAKKSSRLDESRPFTNQPVNRSLRLLYPGRTSQRKKQHTWRRGEGERGPDGVPDTDGRRHKAARHHEKRAKIPARS